MRLVKKTQLHFGEVNIADIDLSARFRDDIPAIRNTGRVCSNIPTLNHPKPPSPLD